MNEHRNLITYDLKYGTNCFFIDVEEGSELMEIIAEEDENGTVYHKAWCITIPGLPMTRRFFEFICPGYTIFNRLELEYVGALMVGDRVECLVFENIVMRENYKKEQAA